MGEWRACETLSGLRGVWGSGCESGVCVALCVLVCAWVSVRLWSVHVCISVWVLARLSLCVSGSVPGVCVSEPLASLGLGSSIECLSGGPGGLCPGV